MATTVVNRRNAAFDVYIGRPSKWGNPYKVGSDGTRDEVIGKYREYVLGNRELMAQIGELYGKRLGCWCKPCSCHGDVLVELAEREHKVREQEHDLAEIADRERPYRPAHDTNYLCELAQMENEAWQEMYQVFDEECQ